MRTSVEGTAEAVGGRTAELEVGAAVCTGVTDYTTPSRRREAPSAAPAMSAGSITGSRKRSCGKNTSATRTVDAARVSKAAGRAPLGARTSPMTAAGRRTSRDTADVQK